ncbi:MAG: hypothetical protein ACJ790_22760, partial [Myxococcaceae bacterium]
KDEEWERRLLLARTVDQFGRDEDAARMMDTLAMYTRVQRRGTGNRGHVESAASLEAAVAEARAWVLEAKRR